MNDNSDLLPNLVHEDAFEMQMRGYSRRQVDEFIARCRSQIRDLEQRLARALDDGEELRRDLATARQQALGAKPAHEEVSERIAQILKLADDEARSQKSKAHEDIARQRNDAQQEADKVRAEAREQAERMLTAAQEQAERAITSARAEAEKTVTSARTEAENTTSDARKKSEAVLASAKAQAKKALDEATARATAIHDGAERRLNLLSTRHSETIKRLTDILDGVSSLVAAEIGPRVARGGGRPGHGEGDRHGRARQRGAPGRGCRRASNGPADRERAGRLGRARRPGYLGRPAPGRAGTGQHRRRRRPAPRRRVRLPRLRPSPPPRRSTGPGHPGRPGSRRRHAAGTGQALVSPDRASTRTSHADGVRLVPGSDN